MQNPMTPTLPLHVASSRTCCRADSNTSNGLPDLSCRAWSADRMQRSHGPSPRKSGVHDVAGRGQPLGMPPENVVNAEDLVRHHHARPTTPLNRPDHQDFAAVDLDIFGVRLHGRRVDVLRSVRVDASDSGRMSCASASRGALYPVRHRSDEIIACVSPPRQMGSPVSWPARRRPMISTGVPQTWLSRFV